MKIDKRILLYYILNIFLVLNMMIILFVSIVMLKSGEQKTLSVFNFFINTMFFTVLTKGIISLVLRLPKKEQIIILGMSLIFSIVVLVISELLTIFNPQIMLQLTILFWGIYAILYNYIVLKHIKPYILLVVLTSIYAFFSLALFIIMFTDIYKLFFEPEIMLSGILSIIVVFVSLEMLQQLAYVFIPEYYSDSAEIIDLFDEIKFKYDIKERDIVEQEKLKRQKIVERRMVEREKRAEREKIRNEQLFKRRKLKDKIKPITKTRLNEYFKIQNKKKKENQENKKDENNN